MRFFKHIVIAGTAAVALGGCGEPEATDDDIRLLIGDSIDVKMVEECPRIVSGLDKDIYKDMPQERLGLIATECRKMFKTWLDDPARNPKKLTLSIIEDKRFAERLTALYQANLEQKRKEAKAAEEAAKEQRRQQVEAQNAQQKAQMQALLEEGNRFLANFETTKAEIAASCDEWTAVDAKLRAAGNRAWRFKPSICDKTLQDIKASLETELKNLSVVLAKDPSEMRLYLKDSLISLNTFNDYKNRLANDVAKLKSALPR